MLSLLHAGRSVPPMVDEVLDLILSAAKGRALGEDGAWGWWQAHGAAPTTLVCRCVFAKSPASEGRYHGNHPEWKEQN